MKGEIVITEGRQGWGNRKGGCEAYGPGGRWDDGTWGPTRTAANKQFGDLLGDHLEELGCHEGSPFVVIASNNRFDGEVLAALKVVIEEAIAESLERLRLKGGGL